jgi:hypothetical protein
VSNQPTHNSRSDLDKSDYRKEGDKCIKNGKTLESAINGRGFAPAAGLQGFGLHGVPERSYLLYSGRHQFKVIEAARFA